MSSDLDGLRGMGVVWVVREEGVVWVVRKFEHHSIKRKKKRRAQSYRGRINRNAVGQLL
jgi:hypothetical protein